jgi:dephospho-CoA kinase
MRVIGLTGGIASGKSAVAALLASYGATLIDADLLAREVVAPGQPAYQDIVATFGPRVVASDGTLNRRALGACVFGDALKLKTLNALTHLRIRDLMKERLAAAQAATPTPTAVVLVIPLLLENRLENLVDDVWLVALSEPLQRERLIRRDGLKVAEADQRLASQLSLAEKIPLATWVIHNDGTPTDLEAEVARVWQAAGLPIGVR